MWNYYLYWVPGISSQQENTVWWWAAPPGGASTELTETSYIMPRLNRGSYFVIQ